MDPISIGLALAQFAPGIVRWIAGDKAGEVADKVVGIAKTVTSKSDGADALAAIKADPALALQFQQSVMAYELALYQEDTKRLEAVNATMRIEAQSSDWFVRRARPAFMWSMSLAWSAIMGTVCFVMVMDPANAGAFIGSIAHMEPIWTWAFVATGIAVHARSKDKQAAATGQAPGIAGVIGRVLGR